MRIRKKQDVVGAVGVMATEYTESENAYYNAPYVNNKTKTVYSTTETKTNKIWINGKPIYRKVCKIEGSNLTQQTRYNPNLTDIDELVYAGGTVYRKDGKWQILPTTYSSWEIPFYDISSSSVSINFSNSQWNTAKINYVYLIFEYTKTTDQATNS